MPDRSDRRRALITGVTGQDGAYLARFLLDKGYEVHGLKRRSSSFNTGRIEDTYQDPPANHLQFLHYGELNHSTNLIRPIQVCFETTECLANADGLGPLRLPYEVTELRSDWIVVNGREAYAIHASSGTVFNYESGLRDETFDTAKTDCAAAAIALGRLDKLFINTGETPEVRQFVRRALKDAGIAIEFRGEGKDENGPGCRTARC